MVSRSDLARMTGLSRTTVGTLVADLQARGLVSEHDDGGRQPGRGRPPVFLRLEPSAGVAVGIDFDHDRVRVALADLSSNVLAEDEREIDVDHSSEAAIGTAVELVATLRGEAGVGVAELVGAGVGLPGPIDRRSGTLGSTAILPGWAGLAARRELSRRLGLHVEVDNDANLGALAEASFGAARGRANIVYVRIGSGLGAGLVLGGRLYHGAVGLAGEIGHVQVQAEGAVCRCGNRGCLETVAAEEGLSALLRPSLGRGVTTREIVSLAGAGDLGARRVVNDAGRAVGRVLADLCNALNPEAIVVGGELSEAGEPLLGGIRESLDRYALPGAAQVVEVVHGALGDRAEVLGALALVIGNTEELSSARIETLRRPGSAKRRPVGRKEELHAGTT
jgi:predicted NBD/HSP70 family sugar kinase